MGKCFHASCRHRSERDSCKFLKFPKSPRSRNKWILAMKRRDGKEPSSSAYLCSCHFPAGNRMKTPVFKSSPKQDQRCTPRGSTVARKRLEMGCSPGTSRQVAPSELLENDLEVSALPTEEMCVSTTSRSPWKVGNLRSTTSFLIEKRNLEEEVRKLSTERQADKSVIQSLTYERDALRGEVSSLKMKKNNASVEFALCAVEKIDLTLQLQELRQELSVYKAGNEKLEQQRQQLLQEPYCALNSVDVGERNCLQHVNELKDIQVQNQSLSDQLSELKRELCKTKTDLDLMVKVSAVLKQEKNELTLNIDKLKNKFSFVNFCNDDNVGHYTGLPNVNTFYWLLSMIPERLNYFYDSKVICMSHEDQLFLTLVKLRRNLSHEMLKGMFHVSQFTITNISITFVSALHSIIFKGIMGEIPSLQKIKKTMPKAFKNYPNCRVIIDCTEMEVEIPSLMSNQNLIHSNYKKKCTFKGLVGIVPNGTVVYASELFPGSTSDNTIVEKCGILNFLQAGYAVMADKGFTINHLLPPGVHLNIPPFKETPQFTRAQVFETLQIARSRIHIERAIQRIKVFEILHFIPHYLYSYSTEIFQVCAALCNFGKPLIREVEDIMRTNE